MTTPPPRTVIWPDTKTERFTYLTAGVAKRRMGERGFVSVAYFADRDGGGFHAKFCREEAPDLPYCQAE